MNIYKYRQWKIKRIKNTESHIIMGEIKKKIRDEIMRYFCTL